MRILKVRSLIPFVLLCFQVWFKNRRAKCRSQQQQIQQSRSSRNPSSSGTTSSPRSVPRPSNSTQPAAKIKAKSENVIVKAEVPDLVKSSSPSQQPYATALGRINSPNTPTSAQSSGITTPSPPLTPGSNSSSYPQDFASSLNSFCWGPGPGASGNSSMNGYSHQNYGYSYHDYYSNPNSASHHHYHQSSHPVMSYDPSHYQHHAAQSFTSRIYPSSTPGECNEYITPHHFV